MRHLRRLLSELESFETTSRKRSRKQRRSDRRFGRIVQRKFGLGNGQVSFDFAFETSGADVIIFYDRKRVINLQNNCKYNERVVIFDKSLKYDIIITVLPKRQITMSFL